MGKVYKYVFFFEIDILFPESGQRRIRRKRRKRKKIIIYISTEILKSERNSNADNLARE